MEQVILEGSPLADYLKENAIQEEVFSLDTINATNSTFFLLLEESLSISKHSSFLFKYFPSFRNLAFFCNKENQHNGSLKRWPFKSLILNTSRFNFFSFLRSTLFVVLVTLGYFYISRLIASLLCIFSCCCWLRKPNGILALQSIIKEPRKLWASSSLWNQQLKSEAILKKWNKLSHKLLQRWNYLRELDDLRRGYGLKIDSVPLSSHSTQDACTHQASRQDLLRCILPIALQLVETMPTSLSMSDTEFRTWVFSIQEPFPIIYLNELKYLILELRERIPRCGVREFQHLDKGLDQAWDTFTQMTSFSTFTPSSSSSSTSSLLKSSHGGMSLFNALHTFHQQVHAGLLLDHPSPWFLNEFEREWEKVKRLYIEAKHTWTRSPSSTSSSNTTASLNTLPPRNSIEHSCFSPPSSLPSASSFSSSTIESLSYVLEETVGMEPPISSSMAVPTDSPRSSCKSGRSTTSSSNLFSTFLLLDELKNVLQVRNNSISKVS